MKIRTALLGIAGASALVLAGTLAAGPAMAAGPGCSGASCQVDGSVTVLASITLSMTATTFSDGSLIAGTTSPAPTGGAQPQFSANVVSGDAHGYSLTAIGGADFTNTANSNTFPASDLMLYRADSHGTGWFTGDSLHTALAEPGATPVSLFSNPAATTTGGDNLDFATTVSVPASAGTGLYSIPVDFAAIGA